MKNEVADKKKWITDSKPVLTLKVIDKQGAGDPAMETRHEMIFYENIFQWRRVSDLVINFTINEFVYHDLDLQNRHPARFYISTHNFLLLTLPLNSQIQAW